MSITFDSWAWIEYFAGTKLGDVAEKYIDSDIQIYTPAVCFMEIKNKFVHEGKPYEEYILFMEERSSIVEINKDIALAAATLKSSEGLHSIDALIYACAKKMKTDLLSGDPHFEKKKNVEFLG